VYRAEQAKPRREVALKVIGVSFVTDQLLRRFELEAQTLGRLKHIGIAQIYEAGVNQTDHGPHEGMLPMPTGRVTLLDVAHRAGVSRTTASFVLTTMVWLVLYGVVTGVGGALIG